MRGESETAVGLAERVRIAGYGLLLGAVAMGVGHAATWLGPNPRDVLTAALPLGLMVLVGASAIGMPLAWRKRLAQPMAVLAGVSAVLVPLVVPGDRPAATGSAMVVTLLAVILLPTPALLRLGILLTHAALILICARPSIWLWPPIAGSLVLAYWLGLQQHALLRKQHRERQELAETKATLERYAAERDAVLADRHTKLVRQAEWATLGRMATGVAHEIKNPLQAALTDLETARQTLDLRHLDDVEVSLRRIESTIREISRLRRPQGVKVRAYALAPLLDACLRSANMGMKEAHVRLGDIPPLRVYGDQKLLTDVLANLLTNAVHAAERDGSVRVRVHGTLGPGHALVYVDDNGPGIPEGSLDRVFETFQTTKEAGKGTGLGLPISRKKLQAMGGELWAEAGSSLGGARLVIALGYAPPEAELASVRSPTRAPSRTPSLPKISRRVPKPQQGPRLHGTLLLIDDDAAVRRALTRTFSRNWRVLAANGTASARKLARSEAVDAVLCDMHLLQEDAIHVLETLAAVNPDLPGRTIFMTGEPTSLRLLALAEANEKRVLEKPFNIERGTRMLLAAMRGSLPPLRSDDLETPPSLGALDPSWTFEPPTEEISAETETP